MPCARCNSWVTGWREYHGWSPCEIFICNTCQQNGWGQSWIHSKPAEVSQGDIESFQCFLSSATLPEPHRAELADIRNHLHNCNLLSALDAQADLLQRGKFNSFVSHALLMLLRLHQICASVVHNLEIELQQIEHRSLQQSTQDDPSLDAAIQEFRRVLTLSLEHCEQ